MIRTSKRFINIGVIGAGQMGIGISYISAKSNQVTVIDSSDKKLSKGKEFIEILLKKDLLKGKIDDGEAVRVRENLKFSTELKALNKSHICIEVKILMLICRLIKLSDIR